MSQFAGCSFGINLQFKQQCSLIYSVPLCKNSDCLVACTFRSVLTFFIVYVAEGYSLTMFAGLFFFGRN